jgi:L-alanine-DL-glutamate epimerase-like enolase superfamily enzyme
MAQAFGLVEAALLDLQGKIEGRGVSTILGTPLRRQVPLLARSVLYLDSGRCIREAVAISKQGFRSYRFRLGLGWAEDTETLGRLREALPEDCRIVADAQAWWQMGNDVYAENECEAWTRQLSAQTPLWLAEPFHPKDLRGRQRVVTDKTVPVAAGEHETSSEQLLSLSEDGVDILQVNVLQLGGLVSSRSCLQGLAERGRPFVLTGAVTSLEVIALAHLASGFSDQLCLGIDWPCCPGNGGLSLLSAEMLKSPVSIENGCLKLLDGPGLEVELNEAVLQRFPWKSGAASGFRSA